MKRQELYNPKIDRGKREYWGYKCGRKKRDKSTHFVTTHVVWLKLFRLKAEG